MGCIEFWAINSLLGSALFVYFFFNIKYKKKFLNSVYFISISGNIARFF